MIKTVVNSSISDSGTTRQQINWVRFKVALIKKAKKERKKMLFDLRTLKKNIK